MSENSFERIKKVIPIMNDVSPSFCLAKWYHSTIYLQTGETHSCYHPPPHTISLEEVQVNPSALHNTDIKKQERKLMLEGQNPEGCKYCWNIEKLGPEYISDRHIKTASIYNAERFKKSSKGKWNQNINPEYIEINFGNECNFKCGYCHPKFSSRFYNEIKQYGPVKSVQNHRCDIDYLKLYEREEKNPYVDAWWNWWPSVRKDLTILRITGGEPLMHNSTWRLFDDIKKDPLPALELNVNSNLGVKFNLVKKLVDNVNDLIFENKIKRFKLYTSIDTWGPRAEYIRTGLDLKLWEKNLDHYLVNTGQPISFMITFNALSVSTFQTLLDEILKMRKKYKGYAKSLDQPQMIRFDTPYLKEPLQYDMNILPKAEFMPYMLKSLSFIEQNMDDNDLTKFTTIEYEKFKRVVDYMDLTNYPKERVAEGRRDFYNWFTTLDLRRGTDFKKVFPEMVNFYNLCKEIKCL